MIQGNRIRPVFSVAARCLLAFAAWQGPIPWCHCHGSLPAASDCESSWLADHLRSYHSAALAFLSVDFGWHMHVAFPDSPGDDDGSSRPGRRELLPQSDGAGSFIEAARQMVQTPAVGAEHVAHFVGAPAVTHLPSVSAHFFDGFAPSLPLPLRFCIARC